MRNHTCCFTGHRPDKLAFGYDESHPDCVSLKQSLSDCIERLIEQGYEKFFSGMAQGSDVFFAEAVLVHKCIYPHIRLNAVVPYRGQERRWPPAYQRRYRGILAQADETVVLGDRYIHGCMMQRNRYMVDRSSLLVAVYNGESGGTKNTIVYAAAQELTILWFNPETQLWTRSYNVDSEEK